MNFHQSFKKCSIFTPDIRKPQTSLQCKKQIMVKPFMASRGSSEHYSMVKFSGASQNVNFMQFSQNSDGFRQNDSQGF